MKPTQMYDVFVIGGGVNGCGIARDAAGRGLSVALAEKNDLASGTSSTSTKLFHGGLRYLEYYEFGLVRKALKEREVLLHNMPHISWPMRFVLPHVKGIRPAWLVRLGLFIYDYLGGRKLLPATKTLNLKKHSAGLALKTHFGTAFEYSDCWVQDARLVSLNAQDAAQRGAKIMTRTMVTHAKKISSDTGNLWHIEVTDQATQTPHTFYARCLINAAGPWINQVITQQLHTQSEHQIRLVRGSHIVVKKAFEHENAYFFQATDQRIAFAIPYEENYTLIGTTDQDHAQTADTVSCSEEEKHYLLNLANEYFRTPIVPKDIVWSFAGVRPLFDDGASKASEATRDYVVSLQQQSGAPLVNIFGGKITTYRKLAEATLKTIAPYFPNMGPDWTTKAPLPGGDFLIEEKTALITRLETDYPFVTHAYAKRLINTYGTNAQSILGQAQSAGDLGEDFGHTLSQAEVDWLQQHEFAISAEDILWRRTKLGLVFTKDQAEHLEQWLHAQTI